MGVWGGECSAVRRIIVDLKQHLPVNEITLNRTRLHLTFSYIQPSMHVLYVEFFHYGIHATYLPNSS